LDGGPGRGKENLTSPLWFSQDQRINREAATLKEQRAGEREEKNKNLKELYVQRVKKMKRYKFTKDFEKAVTSPPSPLPPCNYAQGDGRGE
jgi:hypothetical protein